LKAPRYLEAFKDSGTKGGFHGRGNQLHPPHVDGGGVFDRRSSVRTGEKVFPADLRHDVCWTRWATRTF